MNPLSNDSARSRAARIGLGAAVALYLLSSIHVIRSSEQGVVLRFGAPTGSVLSPGLHFRPRLIDRVVRTEVTRTYSLEIGGGDGAAQEGGTGASASDGPRPSWVTGDTNVLAMRLVAQYRIQDPLRHLSAGPDAEGLAKRAIEAALTDVTGQLPVDDLLTRNRLVATDTVRLRAQERLDAYGAGVQVVSLGLSSIDPPEPVVRAFQDVQDARSDRERLINEARGFANETLPTARGEASTSLSRAASAANERVEMAKGDVARFDEVRRATRAAPALMRDRLYLETMERVMPQMRVLVIEGRGGSARLRVTETSKGRP